jgi:hypothetical protein
MRFFIFSTVGTDVSLTEENKFHLSSPFYFLLVHSVERASVANIISLRNLVKNLEPLAGLVAMARSVADSDIL